MIYFYEEDNGPETITVAWHRDNPEKYSDFLPRHQPWLGVISIKLSENDIKPQP